jgi:hypothetical protein
MREHIKLVLTVVLVVTSPIWMIPLYLIEFGQDCCKLVREVMEIE